MEITIKNGEELEKLLDELGKDIYAAKDYHLLYCNIATETEQYVEVFDQSNTFWDLTLNALHDAKILRLCRFYDQEKSSLSILSLLNTIELNPDYFNKQHFRDRLKENKFVDSLAQRNRDPLEILKRDIEYVSCDSAVKKLLIWRNCTIAHRGAKVSLGKIDKLEENPLSATEIEELLDKGIDIFSRYYRLFRASSYSLKIAGHDDYKSLLELANLGLTK